MHCFLSISVQTCLSTCPHIRRVIKMDLILRRLLAQLHKEMLPKNKGLIEYCNQSLKYPRRNHYCLFVIHISCSLHIEELKLGYCKSFMSNYECFSFLKKIWNISRRRNLQMVFCGGVIVLETAFLTDEVLH